MARTGKMRTITLSGALLVVLVVLFAQNSYSGTCEEGRGVPPFLGNAAVTPNIMLMIDNSASMYDLAYVEDVGQCEDESYNGAQLIPGTYDKAYAGYFNQDSIYTYDLVNQEFIAISLTAKEQCQTATGTLYYRNEAATNIPSVSVCITINKSGAIPSVTSVTSFAATGHFLNWAAASKMDIQKLILTGGKYVADSPPAVEPGQLIMESRGCVGQKMIKEIGLQQDVSGTPFKLSLGLTANPATGGNTLMEIYDIKNNTGYNSEACQKAIDYLTLSGDSVKLGTLKGYIDACIENPGNNPVIADSNAAFNQSLQSCWYLATKGLAAWESTVSGDVTRIKNSCQKIYEAGVPPATIAPNNSGYICAGNYATKSGYVGRCWGPPTWVALDNDENGQTLLAAGPEEDLLYGYNSDTSGQNFSNPDLVGSSGEARSVSAQRSYQQKSKYEQFKTELISSLRSFVAGIDSQTAEPSSVVKAFLNFIVTEAEAAIGNIFVVNNPTSSSVNFRESSATSELANSSLSANKIGEVARWSKALLENGTYEVAVWYACEASDPDPAAAYTVTHATGTTAYTKSQTSGCGSWQVLGNHRFTTAAPAVVTVEYNLSAKNNDFNTNADGVQFTVVALDPYCGDGVVNAGEQCDDGNTISGDGCESNCTLPPVLPVCGNAIVETGEQCDDGNTISGDGCESNCLVPIAAGCGNGIVDAGEQCDDGNAINGDGCEANCKRTPVCGNGTVETGEQCDDGNTNQADGCLANCTIPPTTGGYCGDGFADWNAIPVEECDDGNSINGDGCQVNCVVLLPDPTTGKWIHNGYDYDKNGTPTQYECRLQALLDFCNYVNTPSVPDPSDQSSLGGSGDYWNVPAILTGMASSTQLGKPILVMKGRINWDSPAGKAPSGVIQEYKDQVRLGIMKFNDFGDYSECKEDPAEWGLFKNCTDKSLTADGAIVDVPMDMWDGSVDPAKTIDFVVGKINNIKGATWTPLAEAMYTANGYFGEKGCTVRDVDGTCLTDYRLNQSDYMVTPYAPEWEGNVEYLADSIVMYDNKYWQTTTGGTSMYSAAVGIGIPDAGITDWQSISVDTDAKETWSVSNPYNHGDIVLSGNKFYKASRVDETGIAAGVNPVTDNGSNWVQISGPVYASCQSNNLIVITEGSSTADLNQVMLTFVATNNDADADGTTDLVGQCDILKGSTYFDDLTYYGQHATDLYAVEPFGTYEAGEDVSKSTIHTYLVYTGATRTAFDGECNPEKMLIEAATNGDPAGAAGALYYGEDEESLRKSLRELFKSILTRTSSGSAASVISASRGGEGALYQAIFWPDKDTSFKTPIGEAIFAKWTGEVHSFLVNSEGVLYLDNYPVGGNGALDLPINEDNDASGSKEFLRDQPILVFFDESQDPPQTVGCPGTIQLNNPTDQTDDEIVFLDVDGKCQEAVRPLDELEYVWSTTDWLNRSDTDFYIEYNRPLTVAGEFDFNPAAPYRYIFTWNDLDNDGVVDRSPVDEVVPFVENLGSFAGLPTVTAINRGPIPLDFGVDPNDADAETQVNNIIKWVRGKNFNDPDNWRIRQVPGDNNGDGLYKDGSGVPFEWVTWKLGDVVHSTPLSVASPAENYHLLYRDITYTEFMVRWDKRRHVVYFGANDGMLHAVNGGFFNTVYNPDNLTEEQSRFCLTKDCKFDSSGNEIGSSTAPVLGTEMWAYVPYNLIPHLKCLTEPDYVHKYFVDLRPRIFDVQIFDEEPECDPDFYSPANPLAFQEPKCIHPNGWGTILVGGMRFGGSKVRPGGYNEDGSVYHADYLGKDNREFTSSYFVLDITNPEKPPTLLGEFTRTTSGTEVELGYTTVISTMVPMKIAPEEVGEDKNCMNGDNEPGISKWYLILGSGPTSLDGTSTQQGSLGIVPLDRLVGSSPKDMRIPNNNPTVASEEFGSFELSEGASFTSDLITVDLEVEKDYLADVVYFGTISGTWGDWGGKLNRLVVRDWVSCNGKRTQIESKPSEWASLYSPITTPFMPLIDVDQPITSAATVATDGSDYWVYFGTGRFFDTNDKSDISSNATQTFYGLREPKSNDILDLNFLGVQPVTIPCQLTWSQIRNDRLATPTGGFKQDGVTLLQDDHRAKLGLLQVDQIEILSTNLLTQDETLACIGGGTACLPPSLVYTAAEAALITDIDAGDTKAFEDLVNYISGDYRNCVGTYPGKDGWYRDFQDARERNLGQASMLGGLASFTTYRPFSDPCLDEGLGYLYGVYYLTGTAWVEDVFGTVSAYSDPRTENPVRMDLGKGLSTTPNIHVGAKEGGKAFIQTSVGKIKEIPQPKLPEQSVKSGRVKWRDIEQ